MDFSLLYRRIVQLVSNPTGFWTSVKEEDLTTGMVRRSFVLPVTLLIAISSFAGTWLFTYNSLSVVYPLLKGVEYFAIFFITIELVTLLLSEITGYLVRTRINERIYKLVVYSMAPFMLIMIVTRLFSSLLFANLLGFYGLLILWKGIDIIVGGEQSFRIRLFALVAIAIVVFYTGIRWIVDSLVEGLYITLFV